MIDFARFWMPGNSPYEDESSDTDDASVPPGVTAEEILAWEGRYGIRLPEPIRTALGRRNGGFVRNVPIQISPLDEIVPASDDFGEYIEIGEDEAPDRSLLFVFGGDTQAGATFLMNFNVRGPEDDPSVYLDMHGESTYLVNESMIGYFEAQLATAPEPSVRWPESDAGLEVIAREIINVSAMNDGETASLDQILARARDAFVLFTRHRSRRSEIVTRTTLPLPLDAEWAKLRPLRPAPIATFALHLQPTESDGIVEERSELKDDGGWKNSTCHGCPIYVSFESADHDRLETLRVELFRTKSAARARDKQGREAALQELLDKLPSEQRTAALLQEALNMKEENDRKFAARFGDSAAVPAELTVAAEAIRLKMQQLAEQARQRIDANQPDPETLRKIREYLRDQDVD
jgi:hypothetical protein